MGVIVKERRDENKAVRVRVKLLSGYIPRHTHTNWIWCFWIRPHSAASGFITLKPSALKQTLYAGNPKRNYESFVSIS